MKRVTGIGGIFFKAKDPNALAAWYSKHLGIEMQFGTGTVFPSGGENKGMTVWSIFKQESKYFDPSASPFMINYRVENLEALIEVLREEGVQIAGDIQKEEYGLFGWVIDPEGNKIELWQPNE